MTDDWVPFGLDGKATEKYRVLVDGVPPRMREPLIGWLARALKGEHGITRASRTQELEMRTDVRMGLPTDSYVQWRDYVEQVLRVLPPDSMLRVVDAALSFGWYGVPEGALDKVLSESRSRWKVGDRNGRQGLMAREPEGVQEMVESTIESAGTAGQVLARAWGKVHALEADDPGAYADAVRAVEIAAQPLVERDNSEATLGGMASVMRSQSDWRLPLREHQHAPTAEMIVAMMRSLYRGHADRHGKDDYRDVTHEEARAGVALAATLVSWFSAGAIQRRPVSE